MKIRILSIIIVVSSLFAVACNKKNPAQDLLSKIEALSNEDKPTDSLIMLKVAFIEQFPQHEKAALFTYQAADFFKTKDLERAAELYLAYFTNYQDSAQAANSLINAAFLMENTKPLLATDLYKKFLRLFPEDERCEIVRENLRFVGRDAEFIYNQLKVEGKIKEETNE
jgi:hypothetical protein